ncbi:MAG: hypothetical protein M1530_03165, partial [Candidatus Marsarchaeota archaeon]|nr:hypothetical protein [Candidatus Marsarchaeota archaeon]
RTSSTHQTLEEKAVTSLKNEPLSREELRQYMSDFYRNFLRQHLRSAMWGQLAPIMERVKLGDMLLRARRGEVADVHPLDVHPDAAASLLRPIRSDAELLRQNSCAIRSALGMQHVLGNALAGSLLAVELVLLVKQEEMGQKLDLLNEGFSKLWKVSDRLDELEQKPDNVQFFMLSEIRKAMLDGHA